MNMSPTLMLGGGLGLVAAGALATALVMKAGAPSAPSAPAAATKTAAAAPAPSATPANKTAAPAARSATGAVVSRSAEAPPLATQPAAERSAQAQRAEVCATCGVVQSVTPVTKKGEGTGIGAVAGGVIGGVVGNRMGGGSGKDAMTIIGAVGGGVAGHEIEKRQRSTTEYQIKVRMADGTLRTITQARSLPVGQAVEVNGNQLTAVDAPAAAREAQPRLQATGSRS
jgi:outer membrane lipoprotein SlyB